MGRRSVFTLAEEKGKQNPAVKQAGIIEFFPFISACQAGVSMDEVFFCGETITVGCTVSVMETNNPKTGTKKICRNNIAVFGKGGNSFIKRS